MRQVQKEYLSENSPTTERNKSHNKTNVNNRSKYQKEEIRRIENRYTEVTHLSHRYSLREVSDICIGRRRPTDCQPTLS
jgi:hypothetical protein